MSFKVSSITGAAFCAVLLGVWASSAQDQNSSADHGDAGKMVELLRERRYLELERSLPGSNLTDSDRTFVEGIMANRRNQVADSSRMLEPLLPSLSVANRPWAILALSALADDYEKTFRYADAADAYAELEKQYGSSMEEQERKRVSREAARWNALRDAPAQTVEVTGPFIVPIRRNRVGLLEVPVQLGKVRESLILDTGANLSAISYSLARRLGLRISTSAATSRGIAGRQMEVRTAIIPDLRLGQAKLKNVAVIVVDDDDLLVAGLHYRIPGSLGLPVLLALGQVTFFADNRFGVGVKPATESQSPEENLFLQRLTPVIAAEVNREDRLFTIDTGATGSFFTIRYFLEHKREFNPQNAEDFDLAGAGGGQSYPSYATGKVDVRLGGACVAMNRIPVISVQRGMSDDNFYGNIGQETLVRLKSYTFDFQKMRFSAEGNTCAVGTR